MKPALASATLATVLGLCVGACQRQSSPAPEPTPARVPATLDEVPVAAAAAIVKGPITAARMLDLPPPATGRPVCLDQAEPYALETDLVVDPRGDVLTRDEYGGQVVLQPGGALAAARVLAAVPRVSPLVDEELSGLAADDATAYFTSNLRNFDASEAAWSVRAVPREGGAAVVLARGFTPKGYAGSLAVDADHVYFLHQAPKRDGGTEGTLWRVGKRGGEPEPFVRGLGDHFAWALAGDELFYHSPAHAEIRRVSTAGGEPRTVVATPTEPGHLLGAAGALYFTTADLYAPGGTKIVLQVVPLAGAPVVRTIASFDGWLSSVRHDGESVYWAEFITDATDSPQRVMMMRAGEALPRLAYGPINRSGGWEVHDGKVYWGTTRCVLFAALAR